MKRILGIAALLLALAPRPGAAEDVGGADLTAPPPPSEDNIPAVLSGTLKKVKESGVVTLGYREASFPFSPALGSPAVALLTSPSLLALLAAWGGSGWTVPAGCVAVATLLLGVGWAVNPDVPASGGRGWGVAAIVWSLVWCAAVSSTSRSRPPASRRPAPGPGRSGRTSA